MEERASTLEGEQEGMGSFLYALVLRRPYVLPTWVTGKEALALKAYSYSARHDASIDSTISFTLNHGSVHGLDAEFATGQVDRNLAVLSTLLTNITQTYHGIR